MKKKSVKKTTIADKKQILHESNLNRIPALHALTNTILLSSQVHVLLLNKKIIKEILYAVITSMLTVDNFFAGDRREIMTNCSSVLQTALSNKLEFINVIQ